MQKLWSLKNHSDKIETTYPMQCLVSKDLIFQLKQFIITYYEPILTQIELDLLWMGVSDLKDSKKFILQKEDLMKKRPKLADPKPLKCSRVDLFLRRASYGMGNSTNLDFQCFPEKTTFWKRNKMDEK